VTLYERAGCWKCDEVREVLDRLGVAYDAVDVRAVPEAGRRMKEATGQRYVPALEDGGTWVWDRRRVIRYLDEAYGDGAPGEDPLPDWMGGIRRP
jgi:glutathione S-transferase